MEKKTIMAGIAMAAFALGGCASMDKSASGKSMDTDTAKGECHGVNACKAQGECGGKGHSCAGKNACKGQGWISLGKAACEERGGTFKN